MAIIDSYPESHYTGVYAQIYSASPGIGQIFYAGFAHVITSAAFYMSKLLAPTGYAYAKLYAITGTPGSTAIPDGSAGATSDAFDVSTLSDSVFNLITFTFSGADQQELYAPAWYAITVEYTGGNTSNRVKVAQGEASPTHTGNKVVNSAGTWSAVSTQDTIFYTSGNPVFTFGSVWENPVVTESVTLSMSDLTISAVDTSTITESKTLEAAQMLYIAVDDAFVTTESVVYFTENFGIDCSDSVIISDVVSDMYPLVYFGTDLLNPPIAPTATLTAVMGQRLTADSKAPVAYGAGVFGSILLEHSPVAESIGSISYAEFAWLTEKSPVSFCAGRFGAIAEGISCIASCFAESYSVAIVLDKLAPITLCSGTAYEESILTLNAKSSFSLLTAAMDSRNITILATATVWRKLDLTCSEVLNGILTAVAPTALMEYQDSVLFPSGGSLQVVAFSPVGTMTVDTGAGDTDPAELRQAERFDNYTLEYTR